jgi:hypothetical protein
VSKKFSVPYVLAAYQYEGSYQASSSKIYGYSLNIQIPNMFSEHVEFY